MRFLGLKGDASDYGDLDKHLDDVLRAEDDNQTSAVVELCLARAAKRAEALTNSENAAKDAEKAAKNGCGTVSGLGRQPSPLETERRPETQVRRNIGAIRGRRPSTNRRGNQFEAGDWLPECDIAREKVSLRRERRL
jgi:hypothetical protein